MQEMLEMQTMNKQNKQMGSMRKCTHNELKMNREKHTKGRWATHKGYADQRCLNCKCVHSWQRGNGHHCAQHANHPVGTFR